MAITTMLPTPTPPIRLVSSSSNASNASFTTSRRSQSHRAVLVPPSAFSAFTTALPPTFGRLLNSLTLTPTSPLQSLPSNLQPQLLIQKSYAQCFHMVQQVGSGHVAKLLVEAIDMFLVGTGMLIFGMALYTLFVGSKTEQQPSLPGPKFQVGVLEKLKDVPLVTGFDLACFSAAIFTSSASIFLLSRLHR